LENVVNNLQVNGGGVQQMNQIGSTLQQRYRILEQIGHTRSVTTYLAVDLQLPEDLQAKCIIDCYHFPNLAADSYYWERAARSAQMFMELSHEIDRVPTIYSYFAESEAFYIVREFISGRSLSAELLADSAIGEPWTPSRLIVLLSDLLEILRDIDNYEIVIDPLSVDRIIRRDLVDKAAVGEIRKLVLLNLPIALSAQPQPSADNLSPSQYNLRRLGEIAIVAAMGKSPADLPLSDSDRAQWQQQATTIHHPELIIILNRLIAAAEKDCYPSTAAAFQAVVRLIPQFPARQHIPANAQATISKHLHVIVTRGNRFAEVGEHAQAIAAYEQAIALDSRCIEAYCGRGNARRFQGDYSSSWSDFDKAIQLAPQHGVGYIGRGLATRAQMSESIEAMADFRQGKQLLDSPQTAIEYAMRGMAQLQLADPRAAMSDYTKAIELNPRLVLAYNNRGNLKQQFNDWEGAIADYTSVLAINPRSATAYNNRAVVYNDLGRSLEAIADYTRAIELDGTFAGAYSNRGNTYSYLDRYSEAVADYSSAIELQPDFDITYLNRANMYRVQGQFTLSLADFDRAILLQTAATSELNPNLAFAYFNRGICHRQSGNHQQAISDYTQSIRLDAKYFHVYYHRANARQYLGDKRGAIADYTQSLRFDPNNSRAYYNRAVIRGEIRDYQSAIEDLDRAIELNPEFSLAHYQRGSMRQILNRHKLALADFDRTIEIQPDNIEAYYQAGVTRQILDDKSGALANFSHILEIDPNYAPAYYQRGKVNTQLADLDGAISDYHKSAHLYLDTGDTKTYHEILKILDRLTQIRKSV
jgi:tetratricopeptide (TPR) repeat protein